LQTLKIPFAEFLSTLGQAGAVAVHLKSRLNLFYFQPSSVFGKRDWQPSAKAERSVRPLVHSIVFRFIICPAGMLPGEKNRAAFARFPSHVV